MSKNITYMEVAMSNEEQKSQEELQKEAQEMAEKRKAEYEEFMKELNENEDEPCTKAQLAKAIQFISEDISGIGQMVGMNAHNAQVLNHNMQQIANVLQLGQSGGVGHQTPGGIILPH